MTERDAESMAEKSETHTEGSGRNPRDTVRGASRVTARREDSSPEYEQLMEAVVERFGVAVSSTTQIPAYFVNRRIRNRTYGGVGGREPRGSLLPDRPTTDGADAPFLHTHLVRGGFLMLVRPAGRTH